MVHSLLASPQEMVRKLLASWPLGVARKLANRTRKFGEGPQFASADDWSAGWGLITILDTEWAADGAMEFVAGEPVSSAA
jgi:hypothetical protein